MDLGGTWRAQLGDPALAKSFAEPDFDDDAWTSVELPHHWRSVEAFAAHDGPVLYRRRFTQPVPTLGQRSFLELDGIFYYGDVWLDGAYVGATEGYFVPHAFEVTDALRAGTDHVVALEVASPPQRDRTAKRTITGVFGHWDASDPSYNPGGPWRGIRIAQSGSVRILRTLVTCTEATDNRGRLSCDLVLDAAAGPCEVVVRARVTGPVGEELVVVEQPATLAAGENRQSLALTVEDAPRWWPHSMGSQPLCTVTLGVLIDGETSDERALRTAFREVRCEDWRFRINGERMFLKGTNLAPTRLALAEATEEEIRRDLQLAVDANLDFVRVHAHVGRPELYDAADELGLLVWQDHSAAMGLCARVSPPGGSPGPRDGRSARTPPERVLVVRPQRPVRDRS